MTYDEAVELVKGWPADRSVPKQLADGIKSAKSSERVFMAMLIEALTVAAVSDQDYALIEKHFD